MKTTVKERIIQLMDAEKIYQKNDFALKIGSKKGTISNWFTKNANPDLINITKIAITFPTLNVRWFVTGEGEMYNNYQNITNQLSKVMEQQGIYIPKIEALIKERDQLKDEVIKLQHTIIKIKLESKD